MLKRSVMGIFALVALGGVAYGETTPMAVDVADRVGKTLVRIQGAKEEVSGAIIHEDGFIVTSSAVGENSSYRITFETGAVCDKAKCVAYDASGTVMLLKASVRELPHITFSKTPVSEQPAELYLPFGDSHLPDTPVPVQVEEHLQPWSLISKECPVASNAGEFLKINLPITASASGAPVLNGQGEAVGIAVHISAGYEPLGMAASTSYIMDMLAVASSMSDRLDNNEKNDLKELVASWEAGVDFRTKINNRRRRKELMAGCPAMFPKKVTYDLSAIHKRLSRNGKRMAKKHPEWGPEVLCDIANKDCKIGMTKDMVIAMFGNTRHKVSGLNPDGSKTETWTWVHVNMFTYASKARAITFIDDRVSAMANM